MSNQVYEQFVLEGRELLQRIGEVLITLEETGGDSQLLNELFRQVHTLKGNSGLFDLPAMTRILHAAEDLMAQLRDGQLDYDQEIADLLLESIDLVSMMFDQLEAEGEIAFDTIQAAEDKTKVLRSMLTEGPVAETADESGPKALSPQDLSLSNIPEGIRMQAVRALFEGKKVHFIHYRPVEDCFYKGEDPFFLVRQTPERLWYRTYLREEVPDLTTFDIYRCILDFEILTTMGIDGVKEHFKYVTDQISLIGLKPSDLMIPVGGQNGGPVYEDFVADASGYLRDGNLEVFRNAVKGLLELSAEGLYVASALRWIMLLTDYMPRSRPYIEALLRGIETLEPPQFEACPEEVKEIEAKIALPEELLNILNMQVKLLDTLKTQQDPTSAEGKLRSVLKVIENALLSVGLNDLLRGFKALIETVNINNTEPLINWLRSFWTDEHVEDKAEPTVTKPTIAEVSPTDKSMARPQEGAISKVLKVDESRIDRLMNLIGELVVAKNSLPYLAQRAETLYGQPELSKELKAQYQVVNRIAEEMHDAIMQVRMVPVSAVFQRFPRLVRDVSKRLNKKVRLVIEGEQTEADKNVIEALSEPLIHIIRNSLDHGIEPTEDRLDAGKPETATILIKARHEADHVLIEVTDDGRGIDTEKVKNKAYTKGLITEEQLETISERDAINLIFLPGFSTLESASDLSGRGVGMDVVRTTVDALGGAVWLTSERGKGTTVSISLPLSMAVSHVLIIQSGGRRYGIPMEAVVQTLRVHRDAIHRIKGRATTVIRDKVVTLIALNELLEIDHVQVVNEDGEYAVVVLAVKGEMVGIIVDRFDETADIILKPLSGLLSMVGVFSGTAIMGDGSVLLIINPKELIYANRA